MRVLISNDDGIESKGLEVLLKVATDLNYETVVVSPNRERSTESHRLTLHKPLRLQPLRENFYSLSGSPADCVHVGLRHLTKDDKPDLVLSGINRGANLGQDQFYSGTVAAAREGAFFGVTSIAFSLCAKYGSDNQTFLWDTAYEHTKKFLQNWSDKLPDSSLINVNIPNIPVGEVREHLWTKQGKRNYSPEIIQRNDPRKKPYLWIGGEIQKNDPLDGSDGFMVDQNYVTITPLSLDGTNYKTLENFSTNNI